MTRPVRRASAAGAVTLALAVAATACSGDDDPAGVDDPAWGSTTGSPEAPAVETVVTFGRVTGSLPREARQRVSGEVRDVVDGWTQAAYLGGDYPRRDFSDSWPGFTAGAKERAHEDRALMSNEDIGDRIDGVEPRRSGVRLDVLAVGEHAVGVTARVLLTFRTTGSVARDVRVQGRLYLSHTERGWQVFGYDVTKGTV